MFTLVLGKDEESIIYEGLVPILDLYNGHHNHSFRYVEAFFVGVRK